MAERDICAVCAWRGTCNKKFSISGKGLHCTDFVRDITLGSEEESGEEFTDFKKKPEEEEEEY